MQRDRSGRMDMHLTHELSRKLATERAEQSVIKISDWRASSKVELRFNESKGVA